jgi:lysophospholipase L1-like esterase
VNLPAVYLLGDSIAAGYAPGAAAALAGQAEVVLRPDNGKDSRHLLARAPDWLGARRYAVIHVNCGLHDIKRPNDNPELAVPLDEYAANLRRLLPLLRERAEAVVWARITPVRDGAVTRKSFTRHSRDVDDYNAAADQVMAELGVPINDLHAAILSAGIDLSLSADGVHMTEHGYQVLAEQVAAAVRRQLPPAG